MGSIGKFAFYGTLRVGMTNFTAFQDGLRYIKTISLSGFRMFSRGSYPYVIRTSNEGEVIVVELFEICDLSTMKQINALEEEAGYTTDNVLINGEKFGIYIFEQNIVGDPVVVGGDWAAYVDENRF